MGRMLLHNAGQRLCGIIPQSPPESFTGHGMTLPSWCLQFRMSKERFSDHLAGFIARPAQRRVVR
ncbi:MAG: hypothetical protein JWQ87_1028 [Candidatus Sulfotelmatobacter sp.]|nr:hypothetical protein [Candidatus Sulfotelmatobacter sp.]